jgi:hypothetical protein
MTQEELLAGYDAVFSMTMIYTEAQQQALANAAVQQAEAKAEQPLSEEEKDRLWNLIKAAVEGS